MPRRQPDDELLAAALAASSACPPLEDLERVLNGEAPARLQHHVDACPHCRTELQLLRLFTSNELCEHEKAAVDSVAARLKAGPPPIARRTAAAGEPPPWWKRFFAMRGLIPAAAAIAVALAITGVAIELRQGRPPSLDAVTGGAQVLRSSTIAILSPTGDLHAKPAQIRWEAAPGAARYRVRIMEVDRFELWSSDTASPQIDLPPGVTALIVPAKTLLIQVTAFNVGGAKIAESETARFRLLQNVYAH
jgi:hypothetical protein